MSTFRLLPDHVRQADTAGTLEAYLDGAEEALLLELLWLESDPTDPELTPARLLPWLARILGADISGLTDEQARFYLAGRGRSMTGSVEGIQAAVGATLTGSRYVGVSRPGPWQVVITVKADEVVDPEVTLAVARRNVPAGVIDVEVRPQDPVTLADLDAAYATLSAITATGKNLDQLRFG